MNTNKSELNPLIHSSSTGHSSTGHSSTGHSSTGHSSMQNKSTNKGKKYALIFGGLFFIILGLIIYAISNYLQDNGYIGSKELCPAPPNMKWSKATPYISNLGSSLDSYAKLENYLECINTGATPSPSQGLLNGCSLIHKRVTVDGVVPSCPPPTTSQPISGSSTSGSSNSATIMCPTPTGMSWKLGYSPPATAPNLTVQNSLDCNTGSPSPSQGSINCRSGTALVDGHTITCHEHYTNYLGELMDWISGRPDINQQSKYSLLPGYFN